MYALQGKSNTHDTYTSHASPRTPLILFLWAIPVHGNLSLVINNVGQSHRSQEKGTPDYIPSMSIDWSTGPHPIYLPLTTLKAVKKVKHMLMTSYISLLGSYLQYVISTFNPYSRIPTPRSITNTYGGYNLGGPNFSHHFPSPSQLTVLCFSLMAPFGLKLTSSSTNQTSKIDIEKPSGPFLSLIVMRHWLDEVWIRIRGCFILFFFYLCFIWRIVFAYLVVCRWQVRYCMQRWGSW
jgi:hypothetical protein